MSSIGTGNITEFQETYHILSPDNNSVLYFARDSTNTHPSESLAGRDLNSITCNGISSLLTDGTRMEFDYQDEEDVTCISSPDVTCFASPGTRGSPAPGDESPPTPSPTEYVTVIFGDDPVENEASISSALNILSAMANEPIEKLTESDASHTENSNQRNFVEMMGSELPSPCLEFNRHTVDTPHLTDTNRDLTKFVESEMQLDNIVTLLGEDGDDISQGVSQVSAVTGSSQNNFVEPENPLEHIVSLLEANEKETHIPDAYGEHDNVVETELPLESIVSLLQHKNNQTISIAGGGQTICVESEIQLDNVNVVSPIQQVVELPSSIGPTESIETHVTRVNKNMTMFVNEHNKVVSSVSMQTSKNIVDLNTNIFNQDVPPFTSRLDRDQNSVVNPLRNALFSIAEANEPKQVTSSVTKSLADDPTGTAVTECRNGEFSKDTLPSTDAASNDGEPESTTDTWIQPNNVYSPITPISNEFDQSDSPLTTVGDTEINHNKTSETGEQNSCIFQFTELNDSEAKRVVSPVTTTMDTEINPVNFKNSQTQVDNTPIVSNHNKADHPVSQLTPKITGTYDKNSKVVDGTLSPKADQIVSPLPHVHENSKHSGASEILLNSPVQSNSNNIDSISLSPLNSTVVVDGNPSYDPYTGKRPGSITTYNKAIFHDTDSRSKYDIYENTLPDNIFASQEELESNGSHESDHDALPLTSTVTEPDEQLENICSLRKSNDSFESDHDALPLTTTVIEPDKQLENIRSLPKSNDSLESDHGALPLTTTVNEPDKQLENICSLPKSNDSLESDHDALPLTTIVIEPDKQLDNIRSFPKSNDNLESDHGALPLTTTVNEPDKQLENICFPPKSNDSLENDHDALPLTTTVNEPDEQLENICSLPKSNASCESDRDALPLTTTVIEPDKQLENICSLPKSNDSFASDRDALPLTTAVTEPDKQLENVCSLPKSNDSFESEHDALPLTTTVIEPDKQLENICSLPKSNDSFKGEHDALPLTTTVTEPDKQLETICSLPKSNDSYEHGHNALPLTTKVTEAGKLKKITDTETERENICAPKRSNENCEIDHDALSLATAAIETGEPKNITDSDKLLDNTSTQKELNEICVTDHDALSLGTSAIETGEPKNITDSDKLLDNTSTQKELNDNCETDHDALSLATTVTKTGEPKKPTDTELRLGHMPPQNESNESCETDQDAMSLATAATETGETKNIIDTELQLENVFPRKELNAIDQAESQLIASVSADREPNIITEPGTTHNTVSPISLTGSDNVSALLPTTQGMDKNTVANTCTGLTLNCYSNIFSIDFENDFQHTASPLMDATVDRSGKTPDSRTQIDDPSITIENTEIANSLSPLSNMNSPLVNSELQLDATYSSIQFSDDDDDGLITPLSSASSENGDPADSQTSTMHLNTFSPISNEDASGDVAPLLSPNTNPDNLASPWIELDSTFSPVPNYKKPEDSGGSVLSNASTMAAYGDEDENSVDSGIMHLFGTSDATENENSKDASEMPCLPSQSPLHIPRKTCKRKLLLCPIEQEPKKAAVEFDDEELPISETGQQVSQRSDWITQYLKKVEAWEEKKADVSKRKTSSTLDVSGEKINLSKKNRQNAVISIPSAKRSDIELSECTEPENSGTESADTEFGDLDESENECSQKTFSYDDTCSIQRKRPWAADGDERDDDRWSIQRKRPCAVDRDERDDDMCSIQRKRLCAVDRDERDDDMCSIQRKRPCAVDSDERVEKLTDKRVKRIRFENEDYTSSSHGNGSDEDGKTACAMYLKGMSIKKIAMDLNKTGQWVNNWVCIGEEKINKNNNNTGDYDLAKNDRKRAYEMHLAGLSNTQIMKELDKSRAWVIKWIKEGKNYNGQHANDKSRNVCDENNLCTHNGKKKCQSVNSVRLENIRRQKRKNLKAKALLSKAKGRFLFDIRTNKVSNSESMSFSDVNKEDKTRQGEDSLPINKTDKHFKKNDQIGIKRKRGRPPSNKKDKKKVWDVPLFELSHEKQVEKAESLRNKGCTTPVVAKRLGCSHSYASILLCSGVLENQTPSMQTESASIIAVKKRLCKAEPRIHLIRHKLSEGVTTVQLHDVDYVPILQISSLQILNTPHCHMPFGGFCTRQSASRAPKPDSVMASTTTILPCPVIGTTKLSDSTWDGIILVTDKLSNLDDSFEFLKKPLEKLKQIDEAVEKETVVASLNGHPAKRVIFAPTGPLDRDYDDVRRFAEAAGNGLKRWLKSKIISPLLVCPVNKSFKEAPLVSALATLHNLYVPLEVREASQEKSSKADRLGVWSETKEENDRITKLCVAVESGRLVARDIGGSDPERMAPPKVEEYVKALFKNSPVNVEVISDPETLAKDYPLHAAVDRCASHIDRHRGRILELEYKGEGNIENTLLLVGKGVTYDTGGADIKHGGTMAGMHRDKCGAAAVAGFFQVLSSLKPKNIKVIGAMSMVRNSVGADAYVSDEILTSRAGVRVRIGNTDAEGRMAMADPLCKMKDLALGEVNPHIYTIATLTGHAVRAMGPYYSIVLDNGPAQKKKHAELLQKAGENVADPFEISRIRREDYTFHEGKSEYEDVLQSNNAPSTMTCRGHQSPAAFLIMASGLDKHGCNSSNPLCYSHLDIAGSAGPFPGTPSGFPVVALTAKHLFSLV
uniref:Uncharacterized protein LOC100375552 n=1 Tax=Saccoglossus kowalevskii TaxID=10224 RepID=A0ABM0MWT2_SACKO|nr:PREDICTED: uncharacterized protein LOC100375552 [Saccoglossus kowalevskii]